MEVLIKKKAYNLESSHRHSTNDAHESDLGETEDEEVKMNCIGGQSGMHDSDLSSDCEDLESDNEQDDPPTALSDVGVVTFTSGHAQESTSGIPIVRPKPVVSRQPLSLSPHQEGSDESETDDHSER
jgi:hypothetical protein